MAAGTETMNEIETTEKQGKEPRVHPEIKQPELRQTSRKNPLTDWNGGRTCFSNRHRRFHVVAPCFCF